jgi:hypothetical protein
MILFNFPPTLELLYSSHVIKSNKHRTATVEHNDDYSRPNCAQRTLQRHIGLLGRGRYATLVVNAQCGVHAHGADLTFLFELEQKEMIKRLKDQNAQANKTYRVMFRRFTNYLDKFELIFVAESVWLGWYRARHSKSMVNGTKTILLTPMLRANCIT